MPSNVRPASAIWLFRTASVSRAAYERAVQGGSDSDPPCKLRGSARRVSLVFVRSGRPLPFVERDYETYSHRICSASDVLFRISRDFFSFSIAN